MHGGADAQNDPYMVPPPPSHTQEVDSLAPTKVVGATGAQQPPCLM